MSTVGPEFGIVLGEFPRRSIYPEFVENGIKALNAK
jgi:hypothetical protein